MTEQGSGGFGAPRLLCVSGALSDLIDIDALRAEVDRLGTWRAVMEDSGAMAVLVSRYGGPDDLRLARCARSRGMPLIELGKSWTGVGLSLSERSAADGYRADHRPRRLLDRYADLLSEDTLSAAAASLADQAAPGSDGVALRLGRDVAGAALPTGAGEAGLLDARVVVTDRAEVAWAALARGQEVVTLGRPGPAGLGMTFDAEDACGLAAAVGQAQASRRNARDRTRAVLAVERLYNVLRPDPEEIAAAVAKAADAHLLPDRPRVSVIITAHNYGHFVASAIESVKAQTIAADEVIVVDDGSTDGTAAILAGLEGIQVVSQPNRGQAAAFNAGFARSSGDVVLFLDADDRLNPTAVEDIGRADFRAAGRVQFLLETIDRNGRPSGLHPACHHCAAGDLRGALLVDGIFSFMPTSGNAFSRRVVERILPMPEEEFRIAADLYVVLAAALLGRVVHLPRVLGQYRVHGDNAYFHAEAGAPYLKERRATQRRNAWRVLLGRIRQLAPPEDRPHHEGAFRRLLRQETGIGRAAARLAEHAPGRWRRAAELAPPSWCRAGQAHWPDLDTGSALSFLCPVPGASPLGSGWSEPGPRGAVLRAASGLLAFMLPAVAGDWALTLGYRLLGSGPLRNVRFLLNGRFLDEHHLLADGTVRLRLPEMLLSGAARREAIVAIEAGGNAAECLGLTAFRLDILFATGRPAPALAENRWHAAAGDAAQNLGSGWNWPRAGGVTPTGLSARLSFSLSRRADALVLLGWSAPAEIRAESGGRQLPVLASQDQRCSAVELPADAISPTGAVDLALHFLGKRAPPELRGICLSVPAHGAVPCLVPCPLADLFGSPRTGHSGLCLTAEGGMMTARSVALTLLLPPVPEGAALCLEFRRADSRAEPCPLTVTANGACRQLTVGAWTRLVLPLAAEPTPGTFEIRIDARTDPSDLRLTTAFVDCAMPAATDAGPAAFARREFSYAWHATEEGALWLGASRGVLVLPRIAPSTRALRVETLTLGPPFDQALTLSIIDAAGSVLSQATTVGEGSGVHDLALPRSVDAELRLEVTTGHLVSADLVGAESPQALGGAILSVTPVEDD